MAMTAPAKINTWQELAKQLSVDSIRCSTAADSGHPTSSMSAAELMAVLISDHLRFDYRRPDKRTNDRFVLSKGHASPLLYAAYKALGVISDEQLMTFRRLDSPLQGHPVPLPELPGVDVATGSLGQGLSNALGMALALKLDNLPGRVWVLLGDSEMSEGAVWEAMANASYHQARNLVAIIDVNRLGQRGPTMLEWNTEVYAERGRAFGWNVRVIDGHDVSEIHEAYTWASETPGPNLIVARTVKGNGVSFLANELNRHGRPLTKDEAAQAIRELGGERSLKVTPPEPPAEPSPGGGPGTQPAAVLPRFEDAAATREAFGKTIAALGVRSDVVCLDAELSNSTYTDMYLEAHPESFIELFICEQNMIGVAAGMQALGKRVIAATFGAFMSRAYDFIRMAAISRADLLLCGSHAGVSIGEDGPSQMALEDLAMMRAVHGSTVVYPCDANSTTALVAQLIDHPGISYIRTTREKTPLLYSDGEDFAIGGSRVLRTSLADDATVVAAGVTVFEALKAAERLNAAGVNVRVIDAYSVKPLDTATIVAAARDTRALVVVEDHFAQGGLGSAVFEALALADVPKPRIDHLAVRELPGSATAQEQRARAGIDADAIERAVRSLLAQA